MTDVGTPVKGRGIACTSAPTKRDRLIERVPAAWNLLVEIGRKSCPPGELDTVTQDVAVTEGLKRLCWLSERQFLRTRLIEVRPRKVLAVTDL
jgi:hypothetical protein